jgi:hypothetical protein
MTTIPFKKQYRGFRTKADRQQSLPDSIQSRLLQEYELTLEEERQKSEVYDAVIFDDDDIFDDECNPDEYLWIGAGAPEEEDFDDDDEIRQLEEDLLVEEEMHKMKYDDEEFYY